MLGRDATSPTTGATVNPVDIDGTRPPAVQVRGARKRFNSIEVLKGIDLEVPSGSLSAILGPSGCGKTTLLRCIAGLEQLDDGEILVNGHVVSTSGRNVPPEKRNVGLVFQSYAIWPHMTVFKNVAYGLRLLNIPEPELSERVREALELVGMEEFSGRAATDLSGGQQQRVAIARSVVTKPAVILFDEPLSNLDAKLRERMRLELQLLIEQLGIASIYVTHDQSEAFALSDHVVLMNGGEVEQEGPPMEIYYQPANLFVAESVGLTNIIRGRVIRHDDDLGFVRLGDSHEVQAHLWNNAKAGQEVVLCIRPESIEVRPEPSGGVNELELSVDASSYLGAKMAVIGKAAGQRVRVDIDAQPLWEAGVGVPRTLWVTLPPRLLNQVSGASSG